MQVTDDEGNVSLNPFEVREVLQAGCADSRGSSWVSIPLKSGRCCKGMIVFGPALLTSQSL